MLNLPNYTVHVGSGKDHKILGTFASREDAFNLANFESQMQPEHTAVFVEVSTV